jgi:formylglycine-generating enzyme required for sulfatase activity
MSDVITSPARRIVTSRQAHRGQYFTEPLNETVYIDLMLIPGGTFQMGQTEAERVELIRLMGSKDYQKYRVDELPRHKVTVQPFFLGKYAVTQAQWRAVAAYKPIDRELSFDPSKFKGDKRPVEQVSWDDATEFCQRLSTKTGRKYRLPSEAKWEYACRAGTITPFHFGETISDDLANYCAEDREIEGTSYKGIYGRGILGKYRKETTKVGQFPPNQFGLYDMHGNVLESGAKIVGIVATNVPLMMAVLGLTPIKQINIGCCGEGPGTTILGIAGLLIASTLRAILLTTMLVFESVASRLVFFLALKPLAS